MAIPTDSNDTFLREVDENLRRDQLQDFFKKNGTWIAVAVVVFLGAVGGWIYWQEYQKKQSAEQSEKLHAILTDISSNRRQTVPQRLADLEKSHSDVVRASAALTDAALALEQNNRSAAIAKYRELANDRGLAQVYRDVATIRGTTLEFDTLKAEEVVSRLGQDLLGFRIAASTRSIASERIHRLRGQADMADDWDSALAEEANGRRHGFAALQLDRRAARLFHHPRAVRECLFGRALVGTERHVDRD